MLPASEGYWSAPHRGRQLTCYIVMLSSTVTLLTLTISTLEKDSAYSEPYHIATPSKVICVSLFVWTEEPYPALFSDQLQLLKNQMS